MIRLTRVVLPAPVGPTIATVWPGSAGLVAEADVLEPDLAADLGERGGRRRVGDLLVDLEQLEHALGRRDGGLHDTRHLGELAEVLAELPRVLDERLDVAEQHGARRHAQPADHGDRDVVEVGDEPDRRHDHARQEAGAERGLEQLLVLAAQPVLDLAAAAEHLDQRVAGERLLDLTVERPDVRPLGDEPLLRALRDPGGHHDRDRHGDQRDDREQRRDPDQRDQHADRREQAAEDLAQALLQAHRDVVDVVGDPAQDLAVRLAVEVRQRQPGELGLHIAAHPAHRALHQVAEHVALQPREQRRAEEHQDGEPHQQRERVEVDALPRHDAQLVEHRGGLGRCEQAIELGPGLHAIPATVQQRGRVAEELRPDQRERHARHRERQHADQAGALGRELTEQPARRLLEVLGLLRRHRAEVERAARGRRAAGPTGRGRGGRGRGTAGRGHAASAARCDATISA
jgi:hypothetical protein